MKNRFPQTMTVSSGFVIFGANNQDIAADARLVVNDLVMNDSDALGPSFGGRNKVISMYPGNRYQQNSIQAYRNFCGAPPEGVEHEIVMVDSRKSNFNFCSDEASGILTSKIREAGKADQKTAIVFGQPVTNSSSMLFADTLGHYRQEAAASDVLLIAIFTNPDGFDDTELPNVCEEYFGIREAEPDFDQDTAMVFECESLKGLRRFGMGQTMCSISYANRRIQHKFSAFVSTELRDRAMWYLQCAGRANVDIAKALKVHPSTVTRTLQKLPRNEPVVKSEDWLEKMLAHLRCFDEGGAIRDSYSSKSNRVAEGDELDDVQCDDDDDDEEC